jgi:hypothetical protein
MKEERSLMRPWMAALLLMAIPELGHSSSLRLQYLNSATSASVQSPSFQIKVFNDSAASVALSRVEIRYWFTEEGSQSQSSTIDWAGRMPAGTGITSATTPSIQGTSLGGQTHLVSFTFSSSAGSVAPGDYAQVNARFNKSDWSNYTQTNDFSYGTNSSFQNWDKITVLLDGLAVDDGAPAGVGHGGEEAGVGGTQHEADVVFVQDLDPVDSREVGPAGRLFEQPLIAEFDVLGGNFTADGWVPHDALAEGEVDLLAVR